MLNFKTLSGLGAVAALSTGLSGCVAAAIPLMTAMSVGSVAMAGFEGYKMVQLAGGGSVEVEFPGKNGKTAPPEPIKPVHAIAIWPGDEGDVRFAERLQSSARFRNIVAPAAVSAILADAKTPTSLGSLTEQEQGEAFETICHRAKVDLVFASHPLGESSHTNAFSFSQANVTFRADLFGYSCAEHQIVWRDQTALIVNVGSSTPDTGEINRAGGDAWADRVLQAMNTTPVPKA